MYIISCQISLWSIPSQNYWLVKRYHCPGLSAITMLNKPGGFENRILQNPLVNIIDPILKWQCFCVSPRFQTKQRQFFHHYNAYKQQGRQDTALSKRPPHRRRCGWPHPSSAPRRHSSSLAPGLRWWCQMPPVQPAKGPIWWIKLMSILYHYVSWHWGYPGLSQNSGQDPYPLKYIQIAICGYTDTPSFGQSH